MGAPVHPLVPQAEQVPSEGDTGEKNDALHARGMSGPEGQAGLNRHPHKGTHTCEARGMSPRMNEGGD